MIKIVQVVLILGTLTHICSCKPQTSKDPEVVDMLQKVKENFIFIKGGTFKMGHPLIPDSSPVHDVTLDTYSISKYETTFKEYDLYCKAEGKEIVHKNYRELPTNSPKHGAWHMNWQEAREYCQWLGKQLDLAIDLPTEAQWEYAARNRGQNVDHATNTGKIDKNNLSIKDPVGSKPPSPLGIYDMTGGNAEWILDWYGNYDSKPKTNPTGKKVGKDTSREQKVVRGFKTIVKTTYRRAHLPPENTGAGNGIRCVCNQKTSVN